MQRYFFHIVDGRVIQDDEGQEFASLEDAKDDAVASARSILREAVWQGRLPLNESIQITDEKGDLLATILFRDVVTIEGLGPLQAGSNSRGSPMDGTKATLRPNSQISQSESG